MPFSYKASIQWIAANDESAERDWKELVGLATVAFIADSFGKDQEQVARDVAKIKEKTKGEK